MSPVYLKGYHVSRSPLPAVGGSRNELAPDGKLISVPSAEAEIVSDRRDNNTNHPSLASSLRGRITRDRCCGARVVAPIGECIVALSQGLY